MHDVAVLIQFHDLGTLNTALHPSRRITAANLTPLVRAGASLLAIIGGVWGHPDGPAAGVRAINAAIKQALS